MVSRSKSPARRSSRVPKSPAAFVAGPASRTAGTKYEQPSDSDGEETATGSTLVPLRSGRAKAKEIARAMQRRFPYDQSILGAVMESCPLGRGAQLLLMGATAAALLLLLPALPGLAVDTGWDERHGVVPGLAALPGSAVRVLEHSLGLPRPVLARLLLLSAAPLLLLFCLDCRRSGKSGADASWARVLPASAHALVFGGPGDKDCYLQMFSEAGATGAARLVAGHLVAAPGNTYSNLFYWLAGLSVLASSLGGAALGVDPAVASPFWLPDACYGALVTSLAFFSTGWHATNRPAFHYHDLATMECTIAYLIVRVPCVGLVGANGTGASACLALYAVAAALIFRHKWGWREAGQLHWGCPFAGRWRLHLNGTQAQTASPHTFKLQQNDDGAAGAASGDDIGMVDVCLYCALPVLYLALPFGTQVLALEDAGSVVAHSLAVNALALGWGYRMWERFCLDGNPLMAWVLKRPQGLVRTLGAAIVSPTAILHWTTGLTLLFAYAGARTLEQTQAQ